MFCPECGSKNEDDALFCEKCGTSLNSLQGNGAPLSAPVKKERQPLDGNLCGSFKCDFIFRNLQCSIWS